MFKLQTGTRLTTTCTIVTEIEKAVKNPDETLQNCTTSMSIWSKKYDYEYDTLAVLYFSDIIKLNIYTSSCQIPYVVGRVNRVP